MKKMLMLALLLGFLVSGCATTAKNAQTMAPAPPEKVYSGENHFTVWNYDDRYYVTGNEVSNKKFAEHHHFPYTKTILGGGPQGQTVIFEVNKKDGAYVENLMETYSNIPFLVESKGDNYFVYKCHGRIYVIGNPKTRDFFVEHKMLPLTKTLLGAGPGGETVVFEEAKKDPNFAQKLIKSYKG